MKKFLISSKDEESDLLRAAKPLIKYLNLKYASCPHVTAAVSMTDVEVKRGEEAASTDQFFKG